ncbi:MAG: DUF5020 family protein [Tannerellaceae bacterium]|nr:DUF5020 family protein [Tannerellaceae bacterium]
MKKILLISVLLVTVCFGYAQNIQLHYDFGRTLYDNDMAGRPLLTTTVEMFKPDKWGSTYFFVDMDYKNDGIASAYWEISRELRFWDNPFSAHIEYNGGLMNSFSYNNAYLLGATYTYNSIDFSKGFTFTPMYKYIQKHAKPNSYQLTATWYLHFAKNGLCTFSGFADFWREKTAQGLHIFLSEPQLWVNLNKLDGVDDAFKLSVGTEVKLRNNFGGLEGFYCVPTLAIKWTFN